MTTISARSLISSPLTWTAAAPLAVSTPKNASSTQACPNMDCYNASTCYFAPGAKCKFGDAFCVTTYC